MKNTKQNTKQARPLICTISGIQFGYYIPIEHESLIDPANIKPIHPIFSKNITQLTRLYSKVSHWKTSTEDKHLLMLAFAQACIPNIIQISATLSPSNTATNTCYRGLIQACIKLNRLSDKEQKKLLTFIPTFRITKQTTVNELSRYVNTILLPELNRDTRSLENLDSLAYAEYSANNHIGFTSIDWNVLLEEIGKEYKLGYTDIQRIKKAVKHKYIAHDILDNLIEYIHGLIMLAKVENNTVYSIDQYEHIITLIRKRKQIKLKVQVTSNNKLISLLLSQNKQGKPMLFDEPSEEQNKALKAKLDFMANPNDPKPINTKPNLMAQLLRK